MASGTSPKPKAVHLGDTRARAHAARTTESAGSGLNGLDDKFFRQMVFNLRPKASRELPGRAGMLAMGLVIGVCSSLFGGGAAAVPGVCPL